MRTTKERVMLLIEGIVGKEEAKQLFDEEKIALLKGQLFELCGSEYKSVMSFALGNSYADDNYFNNAYSFRKSFKEKLDNIQNDESKTLQVELSSSDLQKEDPFKQRQHYYNKNKNIIDILFKAFPEKNNVILRYVYEEIDGKVHRFTKIRLNNHNCWPDVEFKSQSDTFENDELFFRTVRDFFATYYSIYIPAEEIEDNLDDIVNNLPAMITENEYRDWKHQL